MSPEKELTSRAGTKDCYRLELIANHSIKDELMDHLSRLEADKYWTLISTVDGRGNSGARMGDGVWPEENFVLLVYADRPTARKVIKAVREVKRLFPDEGIRLFRTRARSLV